MRYLALATDYDGTIAHDGRVDDATMAALERVRRSGRKTLLVTGRRLDDLATVCPRLDVFDWVVAENGAVIHRPATRETRALASPPPERFLAALRERHVRPVACGHVIVATWHPHEDAVLDAIRACGLELQVIFNKGAVMVLPSGVNKATGLAAVLAELGLSARNVVGVGDAENDHAFLAACECGVAVANALPSLAERADWTCAAGHGDGVQELARRLVETDLADVASVAERTALAVGTAADGRPVTVEAYGPPVLVAGASGSGKSVLVARLLEQLAERGYQCCVVDPDGRYRDLVTATVLGDAERAPRIDEALELLAVPTQSCVLSLAGIPLAERPAFFDALLPRLQELRARTGRPHWIVAEEAHRLVPADWRAGDVARPEELVNLLLVTVHPEQVSPALLGRVRRVFGVGGGAVLQRVADATADRLPAVPPAAAPAVAWRRTDPPDVVPFDPIAPRVDRRRHARTSAGGELGPEKSFWFRGPDARLNLRARNLRAFGELAAGVDEDTWEHHRGRHDYSRWFRTAIDDPDLAAEAEAIEADPALSPAASRERICAAIARRYAAPA